jgi:hypothetical protein
MRGLTGFVLPLFIGIALCIAFPSHAAISVVFGESWEGPSRNLQAVVDGLYGAHQIDVKADFIGARAGDPDPWFWHDNRFSALQVTVVSGSGVYGQVGWYEEKGKVPVLRDNGIHDGSLFNGQTRTGATAVMRFRKPVSRFGLYLIPGGPGGTTVDCDPGDGFGPKRFYTNRSFNDAGPDGAGALHSPSGGDVQALVFDLSSLKGQGTWLVCFEKDDSGAMPGPPDLAQTDNDYSDLVLEVTALAWTDVAPLSFGGLKARYTH